MAIYGLFSWLDYGIYSMVKFIMRLIILVANYNFFNETQIGDLADKVYVVLGVLVLFKIIISCIEFMVNPDSFDDKDKGMAGILKKTVICMVLLVAIRPIFNFAITIQQTVVSTIPALVMGTGSKDYSIDSSNAKDELDKIGDLIAGTTIKAFVNIKKDENGHDKTNDPMKPSLDSFSENIRNGCDKGGAISKYIYTDQCDYDYMWGISTAAGIFLFYILASMSIDIGIRAIKLGIIQILAPIPISSYIVSKDKLNKFVKLAVKVYIDLFIRLIVVYFIIFFVNQVIVSMTSTVGEINGYPTDTTEQIFIKVIVIIALFLFAKNAPKFICDVLGIDGGGFGDLKDMFTRGSGLLGTTAAGLRTARSNYLAQKDRAKGKGFSKGKQIREGLRSAAAGFTSATGRGMLMAAQGKGFKDVRIGASKAAVAARTRRNDRIDKLYNKKNPDGTPITKYNNKVDRYGNAVNRKLFGLNLGKIGHLNTTSKLGKFIDDKFHLDKKLDVLRYQQDRKNPNKEYYGYMDYRRDVRREKLGVPSTEGFTKARYDVMENIGKMAADAKGHGVGKSNETPNRYQVSLSGTEDGKIISNVLKFDTLSMEQVRNMYAMAKNGQAIGINGEYNPDGTQKTHKLSDAEVTALGSLVQTIEKRTSYLKEAELMANGDPVGGPNAEKLILGLTTNKDMFNDPAIMAPIREKIAKDLKSCRLAGYDDDKSPDYHTVEVNGTRYKLDEKGFGFGQLLQITKQLQAPMNEPKIEDSKYEDLKKVFHKTDAEVEAIFKADTQNYFDAISNRADILTGLKDAFEEVAKTQYRGAQIADNRAQKAQQAINNNNDKKG